MSDNVCRGCKRYAHEVIHWNSYTPEQQQTVINRLVGFLTTVLKNSVQVVDKDLVFSSLSRYEVRLADPENPYEAIYYLLRAAGSRIDNPEDFGFRCVASKSHLSLVEIRRQLEQEYYALSEAHYHRYFGLEHAPVTETSQEKNT